MEKEQVVTTKRGSFGFVRVTIPKRIKETMMTWCNRSGLGRSEFFRVALMIGSVRLAESVNAKNPNETYEIQIIAEKEF